MAIILNQEDHEVRFFAFFVTFVVKMTLPEKIQKGN